MNTGIRYSEHRRGWYPPRRPASGVRTLDRRELLQPLRVRSRPAARSAGRGRPRRGRIRASPSWPRLVSRAGARAGLERGYDTARLVYNERFDAVRRSRSCA